MFSILICEMGFKEPSLVIMVVGVRYDAHFGFRHLSDCTIYICTIFVCRLYDKSNPNPSFSNVLIFKQYVALTCKNKIHGNYRFRSTFLSFFMGKNSNSLLKTGNKTQKHDRQRWKRAWNKRHEGHKVLTSCFRAISILFKVN